MSLINTTAPAANDSAYAQYSLPASAKAKDGMGQADFLRLMTEQLKNQDPLKPLEGAQFLGQLAQFSTVQGIEQMQQAMGSMASVMESDQSLRAAALVGHDALVEVDTADLPAGAGAHGEIEATHAGPIQLDIVDASGAVVRRMTLEATGSGPAPFTWDGLDDNGDPVPAGTYRFRAGSGGSDGEALGLRLAAHIDSVSIEPQGLVLNLAGLGSQPLSSIRRIG